MDVMARATDGAITATDGRTLRWEHRKPELLRAATEYVLDAGVADLTLRPLGAAIGVSNTTLIRHFGSKDDIIRDVCQELHGQMLRAFDAYWSQSNGRPADVLRALWDIWLTPEYSRQFVFLFELYGLALRDPHRFGWFADSVVHDWRAPLETALITERVDPSRARQLSTLVVGLVRGLYLDMAATNDVERVSDAFEVAMSLLESTLEPGSKRQEATSRP